MSMQTISKCALAALFCSLACFAEDPELAEADVIEPTEEPALGEADAEEFRVSWDCAGGRLNREFEAEDIQRFPGIGGDADPFYCLTRCDGHNRISQANSDEIDNPSEQTDSWCLAHAAFYCARLDRELDGWCWGMPYEDEDD